MATNATNRRRKPAKKSAGDYIVDRIDAAAAERIGRSPGASAILKRAVYQNYARFSDHRGLTWISDRNIAARVGCAPAEIRAARAALIDDGLVAATDEVPASAWGRGKAWKLPRLADHKPDERRDGRVDERCDGRVEQPLTCDEQLQGEGEGDFTFTTYPSGTAPLRYADPTGPDDDVVESGQETRSGAERSGGGPASPTSEGAPLLVGQCEPAAGDGAPHVVGEMTADEFEDYSTTTEHFYGAGYDYATRRVVFEPGELMRPEFHKARQAVNLLSGVERFAVEDHAEYPRAEYVLAEGEGLVEAVDQILELLERQYSGMGNGR